MTVSLADHGGGIGVSSRKKRGHRAPDVLAAIGKTIAEHRADLSIPNGVLKRALRGLFPASSDWDCALRASVHFGRSPETIYRWLSYSGDARWSETRPILASAHEAGILTTAEIFGGQS